MSNTFIALLGVSSRSSLRTSLRGSVPAAVWSPPTQADPSSERIYSHQAEGDVVILSGADSIKRVVHSADQLVILTGVQLIQRAIHEGEVLAALP
ncbi:hypothetical protein OAU50_04415 [Planctomycetota bacterium]|nr:hypothetical protein [Planctomycetota bacterium]